MPYRWKLLCLATAALWIVGTLAFHALADAWGWLAAQPGSSGWLFGAAAALALGALALLVSPRRR